MSEVRTTIGWVHRCAWLLIGSTLAGCANSLAAAEAPAAAVSVRVVLTFDHEAFDDSLKRALLAKACQCEPAFVRRYNDRVLIYRIRLVQPFLQFERALLQQYTLPGLTVVEEDRVESYR